MLTSRLDAYISRYGDFCAHDDDTTDYFTPCALGLIPGIAINIPVVTILYTLYDIIIIGMHVHDVD